MSGDFPIRITITESVFGGYTIREVPESVEAAPILHVTRQIFARWKAIETLHEDMQAELGDLYNRAESVVQRHELDAKREQELLSRDSKRLKLLYPPAE